MERKHKKGNWTRIVVAGITGLTVAGLIPLSAQAGYGRRGGPDPDRALGRMTEELQLTEEQQEQVRGILEEQLEQREEMRRSHLEERETHRAETEDRLAEVLTAEQMDELQQLREDRPRRRHDRRCDNNGRW